MADTAFAEALTAAIAAEVARQLDARLAGSEPARLLGVGSVSSMLGLGRTAVYGELMSGRLRSVRVGRRRLVSAADLADYIARRTAA